jgi:hypothetical protein
MALQQRPAVLAAGLSSVHQSLLTGVPAIIHLALHLLVPAAIALGLYRKRALPVFALLMAGMLIDVDHLLADPVYDPGRCSMGFHPLHTLPAVAVYAGLCIPRMTRIVGIGLMVHMLLDTGDCLTMQGGPEQMQENLVMVYLQPGINTV